MTSKEPSGVHPKLIQANIALFRGARSEVKRLVQDYTSERGLSQAEDPNTGLVMWLEAQAETDREARIQRLQLLVASVEADNPYAEMARQYLDDEALYNTEAEADETRRRSGLRVFGVPFWRALAFVVIGGALVFIVLSALNLTPERDSQVAGADADLTPVSQQITPTNPPDRSRALVADSFTARYDAGILQVTAFEDRSERVLSNRTGALIDPVPGARFYTLELVFECRRSICNDSPEADLSVQLASGDVVPVRTDVRVAGGDQLGPVALGRTTGGWVVFEIPASATVEGLDVITLSDGGEPVAQSIALETP